MEVEPIEVVGTEPVEELADGEEEEGEEMEGDALTRIKVGSSQSTIDMITQCGDLSSKETHLPTWVEKGIRDVSQTA